MSLLGFLESLGGFRAQRRGLSSPLDLILVVVLVREPTAD